MALEPIDCTTRSREIEQEYLKVVKGVDEDTTWLIISPDAKKAYGPDYTGSDFSEFLGSFEEAKVQYGLARVSPPGSDVKKLILVGWCPDSAPMKTKASFAANFGTVANQVLKGYHVQVTARDEDDLDEKDLLQKISNAAGARYSIQMNQSKLQAKQTSSAPVPAAFKATPKPQPAPKSEPKAEPAFKPKPAPKKPQVISSPARASASDDADDWDEPEVEERDLEQTPLKPNDSSYKPIGKIDLQKVIAEEKAREDPRLVNATEVSKKIAPEADIAKLKEQSKLKRDQEINAFLGTRSPLSPKPPSDDDHIIKGFRNEKSPAQLWAEKKAVASAASASVDESIQASKSTKDESNGVEEEEEPAVNDLKSKFEKLSSSAGPAIVTPKKAEPAIISPRPVETKPPVEGQTQPPAKVDPSKFGQPLPGMHVEVPNEDERDEEEGDDDWDEEEAPSLPSRGTRQHVEKEEDTATERIEEEEKEEEQEETAPSLPSRSAAAPPPPARRSAEAPKPALPSAVAEYDYEAGEDNELSFSENDRIINIDFVDDDWWLGELEKSGEKGLFPSNYVSLEN